MPFIEEKDLAPDLTDEMPPPATGRIIQPSELKTEGPELHIAPPRRLWGEVKGMFRDAGEESAKATQALVDAEMFDIAPSTALRLQDTIDSVSKKDPTITEMRSILSKSALEEDNIETTTRAADLTRSLPAGALSAVGNSLRGLGELNEALASYAERGLGLVLPESAMKFITKPIVPWYLNPTDILREPGITISKVSERVQVPEERRTLATDIAGGVGQMGGQIASLLINPVGGTVMLFGLGADIQAQEAERAGATEEEKSAAVVTGAAITGLAERTGLDLILNRVPPNIKSAALRYLVDIGIGGGIEAAEEVVEGILHNLTSYAIYDPEAEIFEGLEREAITAGGAGAIVRGLVSVLTGAKTKRPRTTPEAIEEVIPEAEVIEEPIIPEAEIVPEVSPEKAAIVEAQTDAALDMIIEGADIETLTDEDIAARLEPGIKYVQTAEDLTAQGYTPKQVEFLLRQQEDRLAGFTDRSSLTEVELEAIDPAARLEGDDIITIYRAVPRGKEINRGDYVFLSQEEADAFVEEFGAGRGQPDVAEMQVSRSDLIVPVVEEPNELVYAPKVLEEPTGVRVRAERIISDDVYEAAQLRIKEKLKGLKAGVDPTIVPDMVISGAYHIETGLRTFKAWSKKMVEEYGEKIKPMLRGLWEQSNQRIQLGRVEEPELAKAEALKGFVAWIDRKDNDANLDKMLDRIRANKVPTEKQAYGKSLVEFLRAIPEGIEDTGGELAAMDVDKSLQPFERKMVREGGIDPDQAAQLVHEAGYFSQLELSEITPDDLYQAIDSDLGGFSIYSDQNVNETLVNELYDFNELERVLDNYGVSTDMSNAEIRTALEGRDPDAVKKAAGPAKGIKEQIAQAVGIKKVSNLIREDKALSAAWKKAEQSARKAFREGDKNGVIKERARMKEIYDNARARIEATTQIGKLKNSILKELKTTKVKKGKGKFTADVQKVLDTFRAASKMTEEQAQDKIAANLKEYEGKDIPSTVSIENRILDMVVRLKTKNDKGGSTPLRTRFTAKELQTLLHEIKTLKRTGRMVSELARLDRSARHKIDVETAISVITGQEGLPEGIETVGIEEVKPSPKEFKKWLEKFTSNVGVHFVGWGDIMDMLSVRDKTSKPGESALNKLTEVHTQENARKTGERAAHQQIIDMANEVFGFKSEGDMMRQFNLDAKEIEIGDFVNANGAKVSLKMTRAEARKFMLEYADPTLKETFHLGMGFTDDMVRAVSDVLTPKDFEFIRRQSEFYRTYYDRVNSVYREIHGADLPFNEFYSPIRREGLKGTDGLFTDFLDEVSYRRSVSSGSLKDRIKNIHRISKRSDVAVLEQHIAEMEHFIAWADKIRDLNAIFKDPQVRAAIKLHHTPSMLAVIDKYINDFTRGGIESASRLGWLDKFRGNFTRSILAVKGSITIKQLTSTAAYAEVMPVKDFVAGMADFWKNPVKNFRWLKANSEWFAARGLGNMERDIKTAMKMKEYSAYRKGRGFLDSLMLNVAIGDQGAIAIGMWAQIRHLKKKGIPLKEAIITAEKFSEVTQQSSDLSIQSHFQRAGSIAKIATMFMSAPNLYFRKEMGAMRNLLAGRGSKAGHMKTIAIYHLIIPMIFQLVADGFEWDKDNQKRAMILGAFNGIFLISDMLEFVVSKALGVRAFPMEAALLSPAKDLAAFLTEAIEWLAEGKMTDEEFYRAARGLGGAMGSVTGVPMKQAIDQLKTASDLIDGEYEKALKGAFGYSPFLIERQAEKKGKLKF